MSKINGNREEELILRNIFLYMTDKNLNHIDLVNEVVNKNSGLSSRSRKYVMYRFQTGRLIQGVEPEDFITKIN